MTIQNQADVMKTREIEWAAVSTQIREALKTVIEQSECKTYQQFIEVAVLREHGEDAVEELARICPDYRNAEFIRGFAQWGRVVKTGEENGIDMSEADPTTFTTYAEHVADIHDVVRFDVMPLNRENLADYYSHHRIYYIWDSDKTGHGLFEWVEFEDIYDEAQLKNVYMSFVEHVQVWEDEYFISFDEFLQSFKQVEGNPDPVIYDWASEDTYPLVENYISAREHRMSKTVYYMINRDVDPDTWFGSDYPVCISAVEIASLAIAWGKTFDELMEQVHPANINEMVYYGISEC